MICCRLFGNSAIRLSCEATISIVAHKKHLGWILDNNSSKDDNDKNNDMDDNDNGDSDTGNGNINDNCDDNDNDNDDDDQVTRLIDYNLLSGNQNRKQKLDSA